MMSASVAVSATMAESTSTQATSGLHFGAAKGDDNV
jgi:hypothetical protein